MIKVIEPIYTDVNFKVNLCFAAKNKTEAKLKKFYYLGKGDNNFNSLTKEELKNLLKKCKRLFYEDGKI